MSIKKLKTINTKDELARVQDNVATTLNAITAKPVLDGVLLKSVALINGVTNVVDHSLGRSPLGWIVVRKRATADIWDVQDANLNPSRNLNLVCSADVIIDLWVF